MTYKGEAPSTEKLVALSLNCLTLLTLIICLVLRVAPNLSSASSTKTSSYANINSTMGIIPSEAAGMVEKTNDSDPFSIG